MGFVNQFPYSDFHELNLDWLINKTKENNQFAQYFICRIHNLNDYNVSQKRINKTNK